MRLIPIKVNRWHRTPLYYAARTAWEVCTQDMTDAPGAQIFWLLYLYGPLFFTLLIIRLLAYLPARWPLCAWCDEFVREYGEYF